jgi:mutator protein MutT
MKITETAVLFLRKGGQVLLAEKKRGFGEGKFNGIGGKLELGETVEQAMIRETQEEIGVTPTEYEQVATVDFDEFIKGARENVRMYIYVASEWDGEPAETDEMHPKWFDVENLPYDKMFADDEYWLPLVLAGKKMTASFRFDENWNMLAHEVKEKK